MNTSKQNGFTLIELVVVIVILGILSAFAVPKFMGMEGRARVATLKGIQGSLNSVAAMGHGVWLADGTNAAIVQIEGQNVAFTNQYPNRTNLALLVQMDATAFAYNPANGRFTRLGAPNAAQCYVQYNNATVAAGVVTPPVVSAPVTGGCGL